MKPEIIHEDEMLVIVSKPAGMLTIPDRFDKSFPNIRAFLLDLYSDIYTVHRLDRDTSGILLFAKNADAHKHLSMQFEHQLIEKTYTAIVRGIVSKDQQEIDIPLIADTRKKGLMRPSARGKDSFTYIHVEKRFRIATLLQCKPKTGRLHQIRVHLSAIGYPLLVDPDYGSSSEFRLSTIKKKFNVGKNQEERPLLSRTPLHSTSIEFLHPATENKVKFSTDLPKDMSATLNVLSKYAPYKSFDSLSSYDEWL
ncbi:MAG: RluA family pseudouridine synthase [Bacteroidetes bacterium]|nr:RluA family pseudouridine synthase [bacterium]NBP64529.1 RluA family pseudouridine synthase [Bacteroidota bacterium]